ncbi:MAG: glycosyltransferase [Acidimicrobiales bacterium]
MAVTSSWMCSSTSLVTTASADVALKGLSYLLEAMAKLRTERDVRLTIIGRPRPGHSMDLIHSLGLEPHIDFVSGVPDERIVELYAEAELAVVPSLYEGFSLPAVEAMATGTCLVATDGGALPEVTGTDGDEAHAVEGHAHVLVDVLDAVLADHHDARHPRGHLALHVDE